MLSIYRDGARDPFALSSWYDSRENCHNDRVVYFQCEESDNRLAWEFAEFDASRWLKNISSSAWIKFVSFLVIVSLISFAGAAQALLLKEGSQGSSVVLLQNRLREEGYFNVPVTGYYDSITEKAVRNYQRDRDLLVDGIAGPQTLESMGLSNVGGGLPIIGSGIVTASGLNLRKGPGTGFPVIDSIPRGSGVTIYEISPNGWYRVDDPNSSGYLWVAGNHVRKTRRMWQNDTKWYRTDCCLSEEW